MCVVRVPFKSTLSIIQATQTLCILHIECVGKYKIFCLSINNGFVSFLHILCVFIFRSFSIRIHMKTEQFSKVYWKFHGLFSSWCDSSFLFKNKFYNFLCLSAHLYCVIARKRNNFMKNIKFHITYFNFLDLQSPQMFYKILLNLIWFI